MRYEVVGTPVTFSETFYDSRGFATTVGSVNLKIVFPSSVPPGNLLSHDPGQLKGVVNLPMTLSGDGQTYTATWDSSVSNPGTVFFNVRSTTPTFVRQGSIVLSGNLATIETITI